LKAEYGDRRDHAVIAAMCLLAATRPFEHGSAGEHPTIVCHPRGESRHNGGMRSIALLALLGTGCSFVAVRGPSQRVEVLPSDGTPLKCTESGLFPVLDTAGGVAAVSVAAGGVLLEQTSEDGEPENFTKYYAGPLVLVAIAYFVSATYGNTRVTWCTDVNERLRKPGERVIPINPDPNKPTQEIDREGPPPQKPTQEPDREDPL
jgi:hypothetical protein